MELSEWFETHRKVAIAFSGGVDSAYLLYKAIKSGAEVKAYYVKSAFQPQFELDDAMCIAKLLSADITVLDVDVLSHPEITSNSPERCYYCKKLILSTIADRAKKDGFETLLDGTNASDSAYDRPGMRVLKEMSVISPLRECVLRKNDIRERSKAAGLFTWNKAAYACLATRIATGDEITAEKLHRTETAEDYLFSLGFVDLRVRSRGDSAKIQVCASQMGSIMANRTEIVAELKQYYSAVALDMEARDE